MMMIDITPEYIDIRFARLMVQLAYGDHPQTELKQSRRSLYLAALLTSHATGIKNVCYLLELGAGKTFKSLFLSDEIVNLRAPKLDEWRKDLLSSEVVGEPGEYCPLILDKHNRLYLYRYWEYEDNLFKFLKQQATVDGENANLTPDPNSDPFSNQMKKSIAQLFPGVSGGGEVYDEQAEAAKLALKRKLLIITGGPGTGKTTVISKIIALILQQDPNQKIVLAAPTGKAAAKLLGSILLFKDQLKNLSNNKLENLDGFPDQSFTIHRLLKSIPHSPYFLHDSSNRLKLDVLIMDEVSMVDLPLMAKLIQALPEHARLLLMGDPNQLSSVEAGSILGDICGNLEAPESAAGPLRHAIFQLKRTYRFGKTSAIAKIQNHIQSGDTEKVLNILHNSQETEEKELKWCAADHEHALKSTLYQWIIGRKDFYKIGNDPSDFLKRMNQLKILCAVQIGQMGAKYINRIVLKILFENGMISLLDPNIDTEIKNEIKPFHGMPVLIRQNDYRQQLYNGDMGVIMSEDGSKNGKMTAFFESQENQARKVSIFSLPAYDLAYAISIHKSQGSEYDDILVILPNQDYPVLSKELLYTAVTRTRKKMTLLAQANIVKQTISRRTQRWSGLKSKLWEE